MSASTLLSGTPAGLDERELYDVVQLTAGSPVGGMRIVTQPPVGGTAGVNIAASLVGADTSLYINSTPVAGQETEWRWCAGGTTAGGVNAGHLQLFKYVNFAFSQNVLDITDTGEVLFTDANGVGITGGLVVGGVSSFNNVNAGVATIAPTATSIAVPFTAITPTSVVVCSGSGVSDATATVFHVVLNPGVGFSIVADAAATAATNVAYWVAKL